MECPPFRCPRVVKSQGPSFDLRHTKVSIPQRRSRSADLDQQQCALMVSGGGAGRLVGAVLPGRVPLTPLHDGRGITK